MSLTETNAEKEGHVFKRQGHTHSSLYLLGHVKSPEKSSTKFSFLLDTQSLGEFALVNQPVRNLEKRETTN